MLFGFNNSFYLLRTLTKTVVIIVTRGKYNILSHKQTVLFVVSMKDQYVKLTVVKFIKHENPFLMIKIGSTIDNSSNSMDVNILHTNSVFLSQSKIINQMLCIYFRIDISDKIISELIFQTKLFQN